MYLAALAATFTLLVCCATAAPVDVVMFSDPADISFDSVSFRGADVVVAGENNNGDATPVGVWDTGAATFTVVATLDPDSRPIAPMALLNNPTNPNGISAFPAVFSDSGSGSDEVGVLNCTTYGSCESAPGLISVYSTPGENVASASRPCQNHINPVSGDWLGFCVGDSALGCHAYSGSTPATFHEVSLGDSFNAFDVAYDSLRDAYSAVAVSNNGEVFLIRVAADFSGDSSTSLADTVQNTFDMDSLDFREDAGIGYSADSDISLLVAFGRDALETPQLVVAPCSAILDECWPQTGLVAPMPDADEEAAETVLAVFGIPGDAKFLVVLEREPNKDASRVFVLICSIDTDDESFPVVCASHDVSTALDIPVIKNLAVAMDPSTERVVILGSTDPLGVPVGIMVNKYLSADNCDPGQLVVSAVCQTCPPGTLASSIGCELCPAGTGSAAGASTCTACDDCFPGAVVALPPAYARNGTRVLSPVVVPFSETRFRDPDTVFYLGLALTGLWGLIAVLAFAFFLVVQCASSDPATNSIEDVRPKGLFSRGVHALRTLDMFSRTEAVKDARPESKGLLYRHRTSIGGMLAVDTAVALVCIIIALLVQFQIDNAYIQLSQVPGSAALPVTLTIDPRTPRIRTRVTFVAVAVDTCVDTATAADACGAGISVTAANLGVDAVTATTCTVLPDTSSCQVDWVCDTCTLAEVPSVTVQYLEHTYYHTALVDVDVTSNDAAFRAEGISGYSSLVFNPISPDAAFHLPGGLGDPARVAVGVYERATFDKRRGHDTVYHGFAVSDATVSQRPTEVASAAISAYGPTDQAPPIVVVVSPEGFHTRQLVEDELGMLPFLGVLGGAISGLMSIVGLIVAVSDLVLAKTARSKTNKVGDSSQEYTGATVSSSSSSSSTPSSSDDQGDVQLM